MSAARQTGAALPPSISRKALLVDGNDLAFRRAVDDLVRLAARLQQVRGGLAASIGIRSEERRGGKECA